MRQKVSKPDLVEGFTRKTFATMIGGFESPPSKRGSGAVERLSILMPSNL